MKPIDLLKAFLKIRRRYLQMKVLQGILALTVNFKNNGFAKGTLQVLSFGLSWPLVIVDWFAGKFLVFIRTSFNFGRAMRSESLLLNVISRPVGIRNGSK